MKFRLAAMALMSAVSALAAPAAHAEETAPPPPPPALLPALSGPLSYNPEPISLDLAGSKLYVTAIGSGYLGTQSNTTTGVASSFADLSNAQVIVQKPEGTFQFLVQAGLYNQETLGAAFVKSTDYTSNSYGVVPQAWVKFAPSSTFNVQAGILPTLIGLEAPFTFQ
ncbi:MAG: porin, partial [Novosphingobium sp.]|nr:porin [Novosphingobium sp.]